MVTWIDYMFTSFATGVLVVVSCSLDAICTIYIYKIHRQQIFRQPQHKKVRASAILTYNILPNHSMRGGCSFPNAFFCDALIRLMLQLQLIKHKYSFNIRMLTRIRSQTTRLVFDIYSRLTLQGNPSEVKIYIPFDKNTQNGYLNINGPS